MIEVKTRRLCNFCNEVVRDDDTYNHGECTINLTYTRCYNYDYDNREVEVENVDICSNCLARMRNLLSVDDKFKSFLKE